MEVILSYLFTAISIYLVIGFLYYVAFIFKWAAQLDENAKGASVGFKLLLLPGTLVLWPVLFLKWKNRNKK